MEDVGHRTRRSDNLRIWCGNESASTTKAAQDSTTKTSASASPPPPSPPTAKTLYLAAGVNQDNPAQEKKWGRIVIYEVS